MVKAFKPDAAFVPVEPVGYDIWPFISMLKSVDLGRYTHILKLHTKNRAPKFIQLNGVWMPGYRWRNLLVNALIGSPRRFEKALAMADKGLACQELLVKKLSKTNPVDNEMLRAQAQAIGLEIKGNRFAAGTMFLARTEPYELFRKADIKAGQFEGAAGTHLSGSSAHVYERLLSLAVTSAGFEIVPLVTNPPATLWKSIIVR